MSVECPICRETVSSFVTLECSHKICLGCYHQCIQHSHNKCSLCRTEIKEMNETIEHISSHVEEIENLDEEMDCLKQMNEKLKEMNEILEQENDILEYRSHYTIREE